MTLFLLASLALADEDFSRAVRALHSDERAKRVGALEHFSRGFPRPASGSEGDRLENGLRRFLSDRFDGEERSLAVASLGAMRRSAVFLDRLAKERDDRVLRAAFVALEREGADLFDEIRPRVDRAGDALERAIWVRMLGALPGADAARALRLVASADADWCPRAAALLALRGSREDLRVLVEALDTEEPGAAAAAVESLTRITRLPHGDDRGKWKGWWAAGGGVGPLRPAEEETRTGAFGEEAEGARPYYFGIPVRGRRVAFCCDVSASMRYKLPLANDQLTRAVKSLPSETRFTVLFFNEFVMPWRERLSWADPATKELLLRHLPGIEIKSYTNLFDTLEMALALDVDEIFLISDGEPNRGRKQLPGEILSELRRLNPRRVPIHTVSVVRTVDGDAHVPLLAQIASDSHASHAARTLR